MADSGKRNIPIQFNRDFSVIDNEFASIRERFDSEMRRMEDGKELLEVENLFLDIFLPVTNFHHNLRANRRHFLMEFSTFLPVCS